MEPNEAIRDGSRAKIPQPHRGTAQHWGKFPIPNGDGDEAQYSSKDGAGDRVNFHPVLIPATLLREMSLSLYIQDYIYVIYLST